MVFQETRTAKKTENRMKKNKRLETEDLKFIGMAHKCFIAKLRQW